MKFGSIITEPAARMIRYGRDIELGWEQGTIYTGPFAANYELASVDVNYNYDMYLYGFRITASEPNGFLIVWESGGTTVQYLIDYPSDGTVTFTDSIAVNEGLPANRRQGSSVTTISLYSLNASAAGARYSAGILVGEVKQ